MWQSLIGYPMPHVIQPLSMWRYNLPTHLPSQLYDQSTWHLGIYSRAWGRRILLDGLFNI
jgi:hypothetical protein